METPSGNHNANPLMPYFNRLLKLHKLKLQVIFWGNPFAEPLIYKPLSRSGISYIFSLIPK